MLSDLSILRQKGLIVKRFEHTETEGSIVKRLEYYKTEDSIAKF